MTVRAATPTAGLSAAALGLAALGGLLQTASFAPTELWPLQLMAMALLALAAQGRRPRAAAAVGWLFGFVHLSSGLWWLYISMHDYGGLPAALAALAVLVLAGLLALYGALALAAWSWRGGGAVGFAGAWLLSELARAVFFTGFPWIVGGYAHTSGPLAAWAPWIGVYGIGALSAWCGAAVAQVWLRRAPLAAAARAPGPASASGSTPRRHRARGLLLPALLLALPLVLPHDFTRSTGTLTVTLLQPNIEQGQKFDPQRIDHTLRWHVETLARSRGQLVVTPESSIPLPASSLAPELAQALRAPFESSGRVALLGIFLGDDQVGYTNSLAVLSAHSALGRPDLEHYGKRHLLPFGEFIPPGFHWFVQMMNIPIGDQTPGASFAAVDVAGQRVRPIICFEDLFGEDLVESVVGEHGATLFANATNLAWFGPRMVQDQHLQFSRMRALEFQRPLVRATNTGATAVVDFRGVVTHRLPAETEGVLEASVEGREGSTPYARWLAALGLWPLTLLGVLALGLRRSAP